MLPLALVAAPSPALAALPALAFPALPYVDPSVMTYTIQALAGVAVALGAVAGVAFRRTRKAIFALFRVDENAGKEVEPDVREFSAQEADSQAAQAAAADARAVRARADAEAKRTGATRLSPLVRFAAAFAVFLFVGFTLGLVAPLEMVAGNAGSLAYGIRDIWAPLVVCVLALSLVLAGLWTLLPAKAYPYALVAVFAVGVCFYVQALFLNAGLPAADGEPVDYWGDHGIMMVVSALVWIALIALAIVGMRVLRFRRMGYGMAAVGLVLVVVQGAGVVSLFSNDLAMSGTGTYQYPRVTEQGLFEVSSEGNVIVFILDHIDSKDLDAVVASDASVLDGFEDFTWYKDSAGFMIPTLYAVPYLLTGEEIREDEDADAYRATRYTRADFLKDLNRAGYSVGLYTQTFAWDFMTAEETRESLAQYTENLLYDVEVSIDPVSTVMIMAKCALYRDLPWVLKPPFRFYSDDMNTHVMDVRESEASAKTYVTDDIAYCETLRTTGLSLRDDGKGAFRFIHLNGGHSPFTMDENARAAAPGRSSLYVQEKGSLTIVRTYLQQLKELGVYDDATIIVTADHGDWDSSLELPVYGSQPMLLYKAAGVSGKNAVTVSDAAVSHSNFHATVLQAAGADISGYEKPYEALTSEEPRRFYHILNDGRYERTLLKYDIDGPVRNFENWHYTGVSWDVNNPE